MKKRSWFALVLTICMSFLAISVPPVLAEAPIAVYVNGEQVQFDVDPVMESDRVLVPMRFIFEALGANVSWDESTRTAIGTKGTDSVSITIDNTVMYKNGQEVILDVPARLIDGRTLVPVRAVSAGMGAQVVWNGKSRQVIITTNNVSDPVEPEQPTDPEQPTKPGPEEKIYAFNELSATDMQALKDSYNNLIRYGFEQASFPLSVLTENEQIVKEIEKKSDTAKTFAKNVWNQTVISRIIQIQIDSEDTYELKDDLDNLEAGYLSLVKEAGLEAERYFDITFETLNNKGVMMLLTFHETDTLLACKYIGVAVKPDHTVRYFTAETDILDQENLYFCEVTQNGRGTIGVMGFEKEDFVRAVNEVFK